jgi:hypothetical protein
MITLFDPEEINETDGCQSSLFEAIDRYFDYYVKVKKFTEDPDLWLSFPHEEFGGRIPVQMIYDNDTDVLDKVIETRSK